MSALILTLNAGSSSLKFSTYDRAIDGAPATLRAKGQVDRIGADPELVFEEPGRPVETVRLPSGDDASHAAALGAVLQRIEARFAGAQIPAVGHRIVHGGPDRDRAEPLTGAVLQDLERLTPFAPLHQPHNLAGVHAAHAAFPGALQVGCFDTAFHRGHPFESDVFGLPRAYYDKGVRRYGFHGLSYAYIAGHLAEVAPELHAGRVIVAHLGNGASLCALQSGRSVESTMGFTALDGLPMGSRCGQIDPGVILYLLQQEGMTAEEVSDLLYKRSGLLGLSGISSDMRALEASGLPEAAAAIDYFCHRIRREIGALTAVLGGLDGLVFTAGIGENAPKVRNRVCAGLDWLGVSVDPDANTGGAREISDAESRVRVLVLPTDEELVIARETQTLLDQT